MISPPEDVAVTSMRPGAASTRPETLLYVDNSLATFVSHRLALAREVARCGYTVHVAAPPDASPEPLAASGFTYHPILLERASMLLSDALRVTAQLARLYRKIRPDVVHHLRLKPVLFGELASRIAGGHSVVNSLTGLGFAYCDGSWRGGILRSVVRATLRVSRRPRERHFTFQNAEDLAWWRRQRICGLEDSSIIPGSGVDVAELDPQPEPIGRMTVVLPARFLWHKGIAEFVEAARLLRERGSDARFVLVGKCDCGNPAAVPRRIVDEWVASGAVEDWGWAADMRSIFARCHVVCLPSYREGIPRALLEASLAQRAIVTADAPGCREVVLGEVTGLLAPPRDAAALAHAIARLLDDPELRRSCAERARQRALEHFCLPGVVASTLAVYERLLAARRRSGEERR